MDRRLAGIALLTAALTVALVAGQIGGRHIAGSPTAVNIPAPPQVGDCVDAPTAESLITTTSARGGSLPTVRIVACAGAHLGEVASIQPVDPPSHPVARPGGNTLLISGCDWAETGYLDSNWSGRVDGVEPRVLWQPALLIAAAEEGPDEDQRAVGQHWTACVLFAQAGPYRGTAADSLGSGRRLPATFGWCPNGMGTGAGLFSDRTSCAAPHAIEVLAAAMLFEPLPGGDDLAQSCAAEASVLTGMADPTAAGALHLAAFVDVASAPPGDSPGPGVLGQTYRADCVVSTASGRPLVGSLIGLGAAALPWQN